MKRLPSGTRYGPRWPLAVLNAFGPLAKAFGIFPKIDDRALHALAESDGGQGAWVQEARRVRFKSFDEEAGLSLFGALAVKGQVTKCVRTMLAFERLLAEHPEIRNEKIERPLFVIGWPRSGTTVLQRMLCQHSQARYLPVWEAYSLLREADGKPLSDSARYRSAKRAIGFLHWVAPEINAIHPFSCEEPDECFHLFRNYCAMPPGWDFAYLPSYWAWFEKAGAVPAYELHKRQLQILQWYERRGHWVLKSPQHLAGLPALMKVYPDARIVCTHRDPVEAVASYCSLLAVAWGMITQTIDRKRIAEYVLSTMARAQRAAAPVLASLPKNQIFHAAFSDLMADPPGMTEAIYAHFGYAPDPDLRARLKAWSDANPREKHGRHAYRLSDFDLSEADVRGVLGSG